MTQPLEKLRPLRPELVRAAEAVFDAYQIDKGKELKSQLNHLIAVCNEATCHEEIALYLRYQASRDGKHIDLTLVNAMIKGAEGVFEKFELVRTDALKVAAWRIYAVYLARAFTYHSKAHAVSPQRNTNRVDAPRHGKYR